VSAPTDVEISRALNAISTTLRDQRPAAFDADRLERIATGALAGERKLSARATSSTSGEVRTVAGERLVALVRLEEGQWSVERRLHAEGSSWALPQPEHGEHAAEAAAAEDG